MQLYGRHWRTLLAIAAVVVVPVTLLHYLLGDLVRSQGETTRNGVVETATWSVGVAGLVAALAGILMYLVLTGAITRAVAAEVAGQDPSVEQSYRFGFHRLGSVLLVSVHSALVGVLFYLARGTEKIEEQPTQAVSGAEAGSQRLPRLPLTPSWLRERTTWPPAQEAGGSRRGGRAGHHPHPCAGHLL